MSWIFGYNKRDPQDPSIPEIPPAGVGDIGTPMNEADRKRMEAYRFDSAALERAAQAARELEKNGKHIFLWKICDYHVFYS